MSWTIFYMETLITLPLLGLFLVSQQEIWRGEYANGFVAVASTLHCATDIAAASSKQYASEGANCFRKMDVETKIIFFAVNAGCTPFYLPI